jgi:hypothetical protein
MVIPIPPVGIYSPPLPTTLALYHSPCCLLGSSCLNLHLSLSFFRLCLTFEESEREVPFGTKTMWPWPTSTRPASLLLLAPHLLPPLSPHQTNAAFHLCPHHGIFELNGLIFKGILSAMLLDLSPI